MKNTLCLLLLFSLSTSMVSQDQLYKVVLYRATPGMLLELIEAVKKDVDNYDVLGVKQPYLLRHSQGDHWDLMLIYPVESLEAYFSEGQQQKRAQSKTLEKPYGHAFHNLLSYQVRHLLKDLLQTSSTRRLKQIISFILKSFQPLPESKPNSLNNGSRKIGSTPISITRPT